MVDFYGREAPVQFNRTQYTSPPLVDSDEILSEWRVFKRAFSKQKMALMERMKFSKPPTLQELKTDMESCGGYTDIFPEMFQLLNILVALPVGTASVERSFSQMKLVKTRLRNRLNDSNLARLMRIAVEGPELLLVDFNEIVDIFKEQNHRIQL